MTPLDALAAEAVAPISSGMVVGLGTGRAAARAIRALADRVTREGLRLRCVSTSLASEQLAKSLGLAVDSLDGPAGVSKIDYLFDGADEVDPHQWMIKGRGGAMTREKIVARAAARRVYLISADKLVPRLGSAAPLPIEVMPFGFAATDRALREAGLIGTLRAEHGRPVVTDNNNFILDAPLPTGPSPHEIEALLDSIAGVVGHGLFLREATEVLVEFPSLSSGQEARMERRGPAAPYPPAPRAQTA